MKLEWTIPAAMQLENIYHFYYLKSIEAATNIYNDIIDEVDILIKFPEIAAVEPLLADYTHIYRSLIVRKLFKVVYRIEDKTIYIVAVFDCRQDPQKLVSFVLGEKK